MNNNDTRFWDKVAHKYALSPVKNMIAYDKTIERVNVHLDPDFKVLEFGCGTGTTALRLANNVKHFTATDISGNMIKIAQSKAVDQKIENVDFKTGTLDSIASKNDIYDVVMGFNILHLLQDVPSAARHAHHMLPQGGLFITKSACLSSNILYRMLQPFLIIARWFGKVPYVKFMSVSKLESQIKSAGFEIIERGDYPAKPPNHFVVARKV